jgi:2-succinyl-6-hydroxy-2,4-cyclohexadiene-1-carboxylate synthase
LSLNVLTVGTGPPLLLLHGFTGTARSWASCLDAWAGERRVIAPDLLGHGGSEAPAESAAYGLERQAAALHDLLGLLEALPAAVVGYSMGARLALVLALRFPGSVECLVLESPSAGISDPTARAARRDADDRLAADIERDGVEAFVDRWEALPLFASHARLRGEVRRAQRLERLRHSRAGLAGSLRGGGQGAMTPLHHRLAEIAVPTLVIAGALDPTGLERARVVAEGIPGARLAVVEAAGHTPHLERPDDFMRLADEAITTTHTAA